MLLHIQSTPYCAFKICNTANSRFALLHIQGLHYYTPEVCAITHLSIVPLCINILRIRAFTLCDMVHSGFVEGAHLSLLYVIDTSFITHAHTDLYGLNQN